MIQHPTAAAAVKGKQKQQQQQTSLMIGGRLINSRDPLAPFGFPTPFCISALLSPSIRCGSATVMFQDWVSLSLTLGPFFPTHYHHSGAYIYIDISAAAYCVDGLLALIKKRGRTMDAIVSCKLPEYRPSLRAVAVR